MILLVMGSLLYSALTFCSSSLSMSKDDWRIWASIWSGRLDRLSATWLSLPGLYLISYSNCCRNSDHLVCLGDSLSWVARYCNDLWSVIIVILLPNR